MGPQSYSSITEFEKCARKFHRKRVLKDVEDPPGPEAQYGTDFHAAAEFYVRDDTPMPGRFQSMEPIVRSLKNLPGDKFCELKLGVKRLGEDTWAPAGFFDDDVEWRGIIDLAVINANNGRLVDYKTGKNANYADIRQLDLLAGMMFVIFPELETIKAALLYTVAGNLIPKEYHWENMNDYLTVFDPVVARLAAAHANDVWNPSPSPLCGWCPVKDCEHWKDRTKR
jgi:hypothetical protein